MKRELVILSALIFFEALCAAVTPTGDELKESIVSAAGSIKGIECDFVQTRESSMLDGKAVFKGHMSYRKPDCLEWTYLEPVKFGIMLDGNSLKTVNADGSTGMDLSGNKAVRQLVSFVSGNIDGSLLSGGLFSSQILTVEDGIEVTLLPVNREVKRMCSKVVILYEKDCIRVRSFHLYEPSGELMTIIFKNSVYDFSE